MKPTTDYQIRLLQAVAMHALPHRRACGAVVNHLANYLHIASARGRTPFYTHCKLASLRDAQHRNTSRRIVEELQTLGLMQAYPHHFRGEWHGQEVTMFHWRYVVRWANVARYAADHGIRPTSEHAPRPGGPLVRTKAAWDAERSAWKARQAKRTADEEAAKQRERAAERQRIASLDPEAFRAMARASNPFRRGTAPTSPNGEEKPRLN